MNETNLSAEFQDTHGDGEIAAIKRMYGQKVLFHTSDFIGETDERRKKKTAKYCSGAAFFGAYPDRNFRFFVEGAGLDATAFHERVLKLHDAPEEDRMAALERMIVRADA